MSVIIRENVTRLKCPGSLERFRSCMIQARDVTCYDESRAAGGHKASGASWTYYYLYVMWFESWLSKSTAR